MHRSEDSKQWGVHYNPSLDCLPVWVSFCGLLLTHITTPHSLGSYSRLDSEHHGLTVPPPGSPCCPLSLVPPRLKARCPLPCALDLGRLSSSIWRVKMGQKSGETLPSSWACCDSVGLLDMVAGPQSYSRVYVSHPGWLWGGSKCRKKEEAAFAKSCFFFLFFFKPPAYIPYSFMGFGCIFLFSFN